MIVVGLTGGIASGKSFVVQYLNKIKIPTHESDKIIKSFYMKPSKKFINFLIKIKLHEGINNKKIDKKFIRNEIFNDDKKRTKLEKYLHREVKINRKKFIKKNKNKKIIFLDIPLLFEKKLYSECDYVCSTIAPLKIRLNRALNRRGMTKKMFNLIVKKQISDKTRREKSNYIINTSKTRADTCVQVYNIIYDIKKIK